MVATDSSVALLASLVMCLASVGCMIGGIVYFELATEEQREHLTEDYNLSVQNWPAERRDFDGLQVTANALAGRTTLVANLTADVLHDEEGPLPLYSALVYRSSGVPIGFVSPAELGKMEALSANSPLGQRGAQGPLLAVTLVLDDSRLYVEAFPLLRATVRHALGDATQNHCGQRKGVDIAGECWVFSRLERICVQVERAGAGAWRLASRVHGRNNSYGCDFAGGDWAAPVYRPMDMEGQGTHSSEQWPTGSVHFEDLVLEVRSRRDPHLLAQELTKGSMNFGMSAEEEDVLGFVLIIMSIGFSCPLFCTLCRQWCKNRRSNGPRRYRPPVTQRWRAGLRDPDPEMVGIRYAVESRGKAATRLERAIDEASGSSFEEKDLQPNRE